MKAKVITFSSAMVAFGIASVPSAKSADHLQPRAQPAFGAFGIDTAGMDRSVKPGDDFYTFANGAWQRSAVIPADRSSFGVFDRLRDLSLQKTRDILEEAERRPNAKIGDFYASFIDEAAADRKGAAPLKAWLTQIAAIKTKASLAAEAATLQRQGVRTVFELPGPLDQMVSPDDKNPGVEIFHLRQGGLGLPDRDYYLKNDAKLANARAAYVDYLTRLFTLAGERDAPARAEAVSAFEGGIAKVHWDRTASRDVYKIYNRWTPKDFDAQAPGFDWHEYLTGLGLEDQPAILVAQPSALTGEARLWAATPLAVLKDHLLAHALDRYAPFLSKPFVDANFAFHGSALDGVPQNRARWERGVELLSLQMKDAVGQVYVDKYFPPATRAAATQLVRSVIAAWRERLKAVAWMDPATREKTRQKLAGLMPLIGSPGSWRDYATLPISRDDLVGNVQRAYAFEFQHQLDKLAGPTIRDDWDMTPMRADAEEDPVKNIITISAAVLQPPMFDLDADPAVNYGAIGSFIGHEISHLFDDQGRKYDPSGKLADWWTPSDVARFTALTARLVKQYDAYEPVPGQHIQGGLTLGEDMADLAGITVSHLAYAASLQGRPAPVVGGFTGDQRFYLGWAQIWRVKYRDSALRQQLLSDPHPPGPQRVDEVRNREDWYGAFAVSPAAKLYLPPDKRVQVW